MTTTPDPTAEQIVYQALKGVSAAAQKAADELTAALRSAGLLVDPTTVGASTDASNSGAVQLDPTDEQVERASQAIFEEERNLANEPWPTWDELGEPTPTFDPRDPYRDLARAALTAAGVAPSASPAVTDDADQHNDPYEGEAEHEDHATTVTGASAPSEEQRGFIDAVEGALYEVEGRHHVIGDDCLCGEKRLIKNRDKTKHIARETIAALMGREVLDELQIV